ncbi:MAG TPA: hypothetical protein VMD25_04515 [Acidobacteriaceae bacterium]|nr:hypothetical protein [Acidobacteriaceae bacterium]
MIVANRAEGVPLRVAAAALFSENVALVLTPVAVALAVCGVELAIPLAVVVTLAVPPLTVVPVVELRLALAPEDGALNVTIPRKRDHNLRRCLSPPTV